MEYAYLSLFPPVFMIILAFTTRKTILSLIGGIISAAIIAAHFNFKKTAFILYSRFWEEAEIDNILHFSKKMIGSGALEHLYTFTLLIAIGIIITLINYTGGTKAFTHWIKKYIKSARGAETIPLVSSMILTVDDHVSASFVGGITRPITDNFKVPRAKLAFLVDSMAAPICVLNPLSTWAAMTLIQFRKAGIFDNIAAKPDIIARPFWSYLKTMPFVFYSIFIFFGVWFIVRKRISFGIMNEHEKTAQKTGNLFGNENPSEPFFKTNQNQKSSILNFILPIAIFSISTLILILYTGDFDFLGGTRSFEAALQQTKIYESIFLGSLITLISSTGYFVATKQINLKELPSVYYKGFEIMKDSLIILFLAWVLGHILKHDLHSGQYLAQILFEGINISFLPLIYFAVALLTAFLTGSSWGTMAILSPLAIPMSIHFEQAIVPATLASVPILMPVLGGMISGAIAGEHISPIAETTIMTSACTEISNFAHVYTQMDYAIWAIIASGISFLLAGIFYKSSWVLAFLVPIIFGIVFYICALYIKNYLYHRK